MSGDYGSKDEIEITPVMIAAGAALIRDICELGPYSAESLAEDVFRAMAACCAS
jgi:hypothetical protein